MEANSPLHALHKKSCPNRHCWNPEHLYAGTYEDNVNDKIELGHTGGSKRKTWSDVCKNGHDISKPENYYFSKGHRSCKICKLTDSKRRRSLWRVRRT